MTGTSAITSTSNVTATGKVTATGNTTTTEPLTGMDTQNQPEAITINLHEDAKLGQILVDQGGMTLYLFDKDEAGKSNCAGDCLVNWPPLIVENLDAITAGTGVTGTVDVLDLTDGTYQVLYAGHPLYYYAKDTQPGETNGQAVGEVWWVLDAAGNAVQPK
jgi:predicted lipoprotein with Yx(FWY)xxD motif